MRPSSVQAVMIHVLLALLPAIGLHLFFFGWGIVIQITLAIAFALIFEAGALRLRDRPVKVFITDGSAVLAAVLFALSIPPMSPWWVALTGMFFAIVIAKQLYGGVGHNVFNPAMVGFAAVIIAFPEALTQWITPQNLSNNTLDFLTTLHVIVSGHLPASMSWDTLSEATPLDLIRSGLAEGKTLTEIRTDAMFGLAGSAGWEWIVLAYVVGGIYLLWKKVISGHVPYSILVTTFLLGAAGWIIDPDLFRSPLQQLMAGSLVMCAFFIATDPVSGPGTPKGKIIFGIGIVILTLSIRAWGGFPDGVAFAVLLMNMAVPLIDYYTRPPIFGHSTVPSPASRRSNTP